MFRIHPPHGTPRKRGPKPCPCRETACRVSRPNCHTKFGRLRSELRTGLSAELLDCPGMGARFTELVIDCRDPGRVAEFWAAVLGYDVVDRGPNGEVEIGRGSKGDASGAPTLVFVPVPEGKTVKNRIHIDVNPTETDQSN